MNICADESYRQENRKLQVLYKRLMARIRPDSQQKLQAAKLAWIDYRNKQCAFDSLGTEGGSVHPMIVSECYEALTREQNARLQRQLDCIEGDLSCGYQ